MIAFLSAPGTPIDNNAAERVLKRFVLFRKNSLFYKTELNIGSARGLRGPSRKEYEDVD